MLITGGVHSGEYVGIQACVELGAELQPEKTVGTIVILKVLNVLLLKTVRAVSDFPMAKT